MWAIASTPQEKALARLAIGAFFFALRSCEYLHVKGERKTKLLCVENIRFFHNGRLIPHSSPDLASSSVVSITFLSQKTDLKNQTVTMYRTNDALLCPVRAWAGIIQSILQSPTGSPTSTVNTLRLPSGQTIRLDAKPMITLIRSAATLIGEDKLGFPASELGTHSIRSGAAMAMCLEGVETFQIKLIGRWSSDAFLRYIRKQVMEFAQNVSGRMIRTPDFYSIPNIPPTHTSRAPEQNPQELFGGRLLPQHFSHLGNVPPHFPSLRAY